MGPQHAPITTMHRTLHSSPNHRDSDHSQMVTDAQLTAVETHLLKPPFIQTIGSSASVNHNVVMHVVGRNAVMIYVAMTTARGSGNDALLYLKVTPPDLMRVENRPREEDHT